MSCLENYNASPARGVLLLPPCACHTCFFRWYLGGFGMQGKEAGQFYAPHGIALDRKGAVFWVDAYNHHTQKFEIVAK